ncbi:MAG: S8 family serine peptidase [Caldilineaceae bacterium]|nr:S8 family serine peptidase [Caldilineaceae bacterium]
MLRHTSTRGPLITALSISLFLSLALLGGSWLSTAAAPSIAGNSSPAPTIRAAGSYTLTLPFVSRQSPPLARILRVRPGDTTLLNGSIVAGQAVTVEIQLIEPLTDVQVTLTPGGGAAQDVTAQFAGLETSQKSQGVVNGAPGDYTVTVAGKKGGQEKSEAAGFFLLEDQAMLVASSPVTFPITSQPDIALSFEDRTVLLSFSFAATQDDISEFLIAQQLRPLDVAPAFGLLRVQIPDGETPVQVVERLMSAQNPLLTAATLNFVLEDDVATGEKLPARLAGSYLATAGDGCTAGGGTIEGCFDFSGDPDNNSADELRIFRYHFLMDTFAAHRLVEHLVMTPTANAGLAVVDRGLGNGVNTTDIPNGALFHLSTAPLVLDANGVQVRYWNGAAWIAGQPPIANLADLASGHGTSVATAAAGRGTQVLGPGMHAQVRPIRRTSANFADSVFGVLGAAYDTQVDVVNTSWGGFGLTPAQFTSLNLGAYSVNVLRIVSMPFLDVGLDGNRNTVDADGSQGNGRFDFTDANANNVHDAGEASEPFIDRNSNGAFDAFDALVWVASTGNNNGQNIGTTRLPGAFAPDANPRGAWNPFDGFNQQRELTMLSVSASGTNDRVRGPEGLASYSNWGQRTSVAAPGDAIILPDRNGNLRRISGTSFSAPTTAGLATEMIYLDKNLGQGLTPLQIIEMIEATADDLGTTTAAVNTTRPNNSPGDGLDAYFGHGRINVWKAILGVVNRGVAVESHPQLAAQFPSLTTINEANTKWYGLKVHAPIRGSTLWIDGVQVTDAGSTAPGGVNAYAGVRTDRTIRIGVKGEDPTSGIVPLGSESDFLITVSVERADLYAAKPKSLQLRRPGQTAADAPFFVLELKLQDMRDNKIPGVVFDDFVFEITPPDFGDSSASPTSLADDGARHLNFQMEYFGKANAFYSLEAVSPEHKVFGVTDPDGITNWGTDLEDLDGYDDGVTLYPLSYKPGGKGRADVQVCVAETGPRYDAADLDKQLFVNGWIDWNTNGSWQEGTEHVLDGLRLAPITTTAAGWAVRGVDAGAVSLLSSNSDCGLYKVEFPVPAKVGTGHLQARFRLDYGENVGRHANTTFPSSATLSQTVGAAFYGEVEDYIIGPDFGDAGPDKPWPTKLSSDGPRHLSYYREWIGSYNSGTPRASREPDACETLESDMDGDDNLGKICNKVNQDGMDDFAVSIPKPGKVRVLFDVSSGVQGYGFDGANAGVKTLASDCSLVGLGATPETPKHQRVKMRYDAGNSAERLYVNIYADWNGDGSFETHLLSGPVDPESFGADGFYTLGEAFTDSNGDGVWNSGETFTDAAGETTKSFDCEFDAPTPPPAGVTQWVRIRLDWGENSIGAMRGEPFEEDPLHKGSDDRGGSVWGEVEDAPLIGGPPHRTWRVPLTPGVPVTTESLPVDGLDGTGPYTFRLVTDNVTIDGMTNTPLPPGLHLDTATGALSGVTLQGGDYHPLVETLSGAGTPSESVVALEWFNCPVPVQITTHLLNQVTGRPIPNKEMRLYTGTECTGTPVATATTDARGLVHFPNLEPITYTVQLPAQPGVTGVGNTCQWVNMGEFRAITRTLYYTDTLPNGPGTVQIPLYGAVWGTKQAESKFFLLQGGATVNFGPLQQPGPNQFFDVEITQMHLQGWNSPTDTIEIRESPGQPSIGQIQQLPGNGDFRVDSFFDVWTEVSLDGGQTWVPSEQSVRHQDANPANSFPPTGATLTGQNTTYGSPSQAEFVEIYKSIIALDPTVQTLLMLGLEDSP